MRILLAFNGEFFHVGAFFRKALEEMGHSFLFLDDREYFQVLDRSLVHKAAARLLGKPLTYSRFNRDLAESARRFRPQLVLIGKGAYVAPGTLERIQRETGAVLANFSSDDPFNPAVSTRDILEGIPHYDLYVCTKRAILDDVHRAGCAHAVFVPFAYEPALHFPEKPATPEEEQRFSSDVVFAGGADRDRFPYFETLLEKLPGVRLHLYGGFWERHPRLRRRHRGMALGRDYRLAIGGAKIAPCLVRRANRDGHVMRTFEIPACGGFLLAERTAEHLEFFEEDKEAAYFSSPEEMADKVRYYLNHEAERVRLAQAAHRRVVAERHTYRHRLEQILALVCEKLGTAG